MQAQILDLLVNLQEEFGTSYLFISHDIRAVNDVADYVVVMKNGEVVEERDAESVLFNPEHDYTKTLISSSFLSEEGEIYAM
ncbi:hypothetical protein [Oceanobacillus alkalisoli]|uniref:hypothetical protein n=1 Tax=Oceanobacillus alkalisoli TaxID=2925113 RepID=UPI001EF0205B|nr:hypothetical protein [Oceanobacillus alkalisoli]MCF3942854.1 hypothetical protein [Oceanobacillus alkalisoli]MCG5102422.1 hypothetical protein [Oceanobacillus alkalisoli]